MENEQVTVYATVEFQISHGLDTDIVKEFIIKSLDWKIFFTNLAFVFDFFIINVLQIVVDETVTKCPEISWWDDN